MTDVRQPHTGPTAPAGPAAFRLDGVLFLGGSAENPVTVDDISLVVDDEGVSVSHGGEGTPRVLPWALLSTYVVEPWSGGVLPEWWVDPELNRDPEAEDALGTIVIDPVATNRPLPHTEPGALLSLKTPNATYRFLKPGGDAADLGTRVAALALSHLGAAGAPTTTTVARAAGTDGQQAAGPAIWPRVQVVLVVLLVVLLLTAVTLILLQSAGKIHIPILGGTSPSGLAAAA